MCSLLHLCYTLQQPAHLSQPCAPCLQVMEDDKQLVEYRIKNRSRFQLKLAEAC